MGALTDTNVVLLGGSMVERASMSETANGLPVARFYLRCRDVWQANDRRHHCRDICILCVGYGHNARKIAKYGSPNCELVVSGKLAVLTAQDAAGDAVNTVYVHCRDIGFTRISGLLYLTQHGTSQYQRTVENSEPNEDSDT